MINSDAVFLETLHKMQDQHFDTAFAFIDRFKAVIEAAPDLPQVKVLAQIAA